MQGSTYPCRYEPSPEIASSDLRRSACEQIGWHAPSPTLFASLSEGRPPKRSPKRHRPKARAFARQVLGAGLWVIAAVSPYLSAWVDQPLLPSDPITRMSCLSPCTQPWCRSPGKIAKARQRALEHKAIVARNCSTRKLSPILHHSCFS